MSRKILIVDDNAVNRLLLKNTLNSDYDVLEAEDGREALHIIQRHYKMLSAVLTDIVMPVMDGYELLKEIRDNVLFTQIPVIMVTGSEDEASRVKALSFGANDFILKPFNPDIVKHCVKNNIALRETASILNAIQKDKLTGLFNREAFFERAAAAVKEREPGYYILSSFDIDNFKLINDQYGAVEGDRILREIGKVVLEDMEEIGGVGGRISADNFAVLIPYSRREMSITRIIQQNRMAFSDKQAIQFSVGRYIVTDLSLPASAFYDRAYIAKQSVKGRYDVHIAYFDDAMLDKLVRDQQIIADMDAAIAERQFEVWFQPQRNHATGALVGAEALVRWRHPEKGLIPPGDFIPMFEQNGFVYALDKYVWEETCRLLHQWIGEGRNPLPVSVNISRYDIFRPDLIGVLTDLVAEYEIPVELLRLEITESAFAKSSEQIVAIVKKLIELGFTVEIDDFGSGYSSLNTLKSVPAQVVKLDMRFLEDDDGSGRGGNILESIVRMTKWLGMSVIAEGVESLAQADYLTSIGCSYIQGYLYARPMPPSDYEAYCKGAGKEERLLTMETVENLDNFSFWDPASMDTLIFNSYVGGACVLEYYAGNLEMLRVTKKYVAMLGSVSLTLEDVLKLDWSHHLDQDDQKRLADNLAEAIASGREFTAEYRFLDLPGCPHETYLRSSIRVIASTEDRRLIYCISENITAQRMAEQRMLDASRQLQTMMDDIPGGYCRLRVLPDGVVKLVFFNQGLCRLTGMSQVEIWDVCGKNVIAGVHPEDCDIVKSAVAQMLQDGEASSARYRLLHKGGDYAWVRIFGRASRDKTGDTYLNFYYTDASEQVKEEDRQKELLDNLPYGASLFEYDGSNLSVVHMNKRYWQLVNRGKMRHYQADFLSAIHPEDRAVVNRELPAAIRQNRDAVCDLRVLCGENEYRPFRVVGHIVRRKDGVYSIYASYTPISDEAMSIQEMLPVALQAVMDASTEISFVKGKDLRYISCSHAFALLMGRDDENELLGRTSFDVFPEKLALENTAADHTVIESGRSLVDRDILFPTDHGMRHLLFSRYPLLDGKGNVLGIYGTGRDVTEARNAQSRLEALTNNIPGGVAVFEAAPGALDKIRVTYFSDGFCRLIGYTRAAYAAIAANDPLSLVYPEDVPKMHERIRALVQDGVPLDLVYHAKINGGASKWVQIKAVLGEPNEDRLTANALFLDVTEQMDAMERLRVSEEFNRLALQLTKSVVCRYDVATKRLTTPPSINPIFEISPVEENIPDQPVRDGKLSPDTADAYVEFYESIRRGEKNGKALFLRRSSQGWRWVEAHFTTIFNDEDAPVAGVVSFNDVTESIEKDAAYKKWQQSIRDRKPESYSLYHCNVSKNSILDATEGMLLPEESGALATCLSERTAHYAEHCVYSEDRERFLTAMDRQTLLVRFGQGRRTNTLEYRELLPGGDVRWLRLTVDLTDSPYSSDVDAYLLFENIDEAKRAELEMIERAETDPLTGVLNRATFAQRVDMRIEASSPDARHALLMLDIDGFKLVNDVFGHAAGDQMLMDVADLLRQGSRRCDLVGRLGGDEFVVFLPDIPGEEAAAKKAAQICEVTRKSFSTEVQVSGSVGVALYPQDGDSFESLYKRADETLYYVKDTGKNSYAFYQPQLEEAKTPPSAPASGGPGRAWNARKRRMLIVDDSRIDFELLANLFKDEFKVEKALDGASALIKLHHYGSAISIVLLDLLMPGMDGFAVLEKMQQSADMKSIPVIVVSAADAHDVSLRAIRSGAADFVTKPVDPDVLRIRVQSAVSKADNERLRAQNSFLELRTSETNSYKTVLERTGTLVIQHDWGTGAFIYGPSLSSRLAGRYDERSFWHILMSDMVTDPKTVSRMQQLVHDVANDRNRQEGSMPVRLKSASGEKKDFEMNVYKQANSFGLTDKLILTFREREPRQTPSDAS